MKTWFWIRWFLIFECVSTEQRNFRIIIDNITTRIFETDTVEKFDCQVLQISNRNYVNCQLFLSRQIVQVNIRTILDFWKPNGKAMKLYDAQLDACLLLENNQINKFFDLYSKTLKKYSNLGCPLKANLNYSIEKLYIDEKDYPPFLPLGSFRCLSDFYLNQSKVGLRAIARGKVIARL